MRRFSALLQIAALCCAWGVPGSARCQGCIEYEDFLHTAGTVDTPDAAIGVAVAGSYAYVADRYSGLQVVDITAPGSPRIVGSVDTPGGAYNVAVSGDHAYVADRIGLQVVDVSDPRLPRLVGFVETPDAYDVAVEADHVYIADTWAGLLVIDVSDPTAPRIVGSQFVAYAIGVAVAGSYAYVTDFGSGLRVIDVSDPTAPRIIGSVDTPDPEEGPLDVAVAGNHVYVTLGEPGLEVIDVSNAASPQKVAHVHMPGNSRSVAVAGTHAYVSNSFLEGLQVIDISDPASPQIVGSLSTTDTALGVVALGNFAYVAAAYSGLRIIDGGNPRSPPVGSVDTGAEPSSSAYGVAISGQHAYVADYASGLHVIDISDPLLPRIVGSLQTSHLAYDVAVAGNYVCVAEGVSLEIVDASDPTSPRIVGSLETLTNGGARHLAVADSTVYFADYSGVIQAVDLSDPTSPRVVGWSNVLAYANDLAVASGYAYVAGGDLFSGSRFSVFDIRELPSLRWVGSNYALRSPNSVAVAGDYAYVTDHGSDWQSFRVLDVSDPVSPTVVGSVGIPTKAAKGVAIAGRYAYVADGYWIHVIDVSDPRSPRIASSVLMVGSTSIALTDHHACIAASSFGFGIMDRQCDGSTPVLLTAFSLTPIGAEVEIRWQVFDTAEIDAFRLVANSEHDGWEVPVPVEIGRSFVVRDRSPRLGDATTVTYSLFYHGADRAWRQLAQQTLSLHGPVAVTRLLDPYPNPFNPQVNIPFTLDASKNVRVTVYDAVGREIVRLWEGDAPRGRNQVVWEGRDTRGRRVGSGVYVVRLESSQGTQSRRLVLLK